MTRTPTGRGVGRNGRPRHPVRAFAAALVAIAGLLAPLAVGPAVETALAAPSATPVGDAETPGIWGTHTVDFVVDGATVAEVEVADGRHVARQPAPEAAGLVFVGWFVDDGDVEFSFDGTAVTSDLTVVARFSDARIVQFLAPETGAPGATPRVLETVQRADGDPLGDVSPDVPELPDGTVFTGEWYLAGDASQTPYDFSLPVTENLVLAPRIVDGFGVSFVTGGSSVAPVFVVEPDTEFTQAMLDAVPEPSRTGYDFTGWFADEAATVPPTLPITDTATLYAGWTGQDVGYQVAYWLEKPNIVPDGYPAAAFTPGTGAPPAWDDTVGALSPAQLADRATYRFLGETPGTATAGSTVGGPTAKSGIPAGIALLVREQLDPAVVQPDPLLFADLAISEQDVVVSGDGSTVVNVYLTRSLWRLDYLLRAPGAAEGARCTGLGQYDVTMTVGGSTVYASPTPPASAAQLGTYSIRVKIGLDIHALDVAPMVLSDDGSEQLITATYVPDPANPATACLIRGWGAQQANPTVFQAAQTGANADAGSVNRTAKTTRMTSRWIQSSTQHLTEQHLYVEALDQSKPATDVVYGPDGTPNSPLRVDTLYANNRTSVLVAIPPAAQVMDDFSQKWYWAQDCDRQVTGVIDGFESYVGYGDGPGNVGNCFQYDTARSLFYQLNDTGNSNEQHRFFFYSRKSYTLSFDTGGGSPISPATARYQAPLDGLAPADPVRGDDVFQGWYTDSSFLEPFDFAGATMPASNLVLFAKWLRNPHTVEFYADAQAAAPIDELTQLVADQGRASDPGPLPDRPDGTTFAGWYVRTAEGYFLPYDWSSTVGSDLALYARWLQPPGSPFAVTYDGAGATAGTVPGDPWRYDAGTSAIVAGGDGLRRGDAVFVGWQLQGPAPDASGLGPSDGLYQRGQTVPISRDITLLAVYAAPDPAYTVTFEENGGFGFEVEWDAVGGAKITYPDAADLAFVGPPGASFLGWSTDPRASEPDPAYDRLVVGTVTGDLVLYAVWRLPVPPTPEPPGPAPAPGGKLPGTGWEGWLLLPAVGLMLAGAIARAAVIRRRRA
ncbi:InlB B-repeat-containing protein [Agromyces mediolanus]|uniref:InlB B-repeat-containing protein n=1 Tax=Agromyces mediolanus TaxID=41986 RepID=A0A918CN40_AGRME|nr:InlB B-repeat-containing protein [Agromyces mediolanus]GGR31379.1 hypothetical protein GCM10010196_27050 [Agromyces mediolanus]GLJ72501.1 hypothetical protein GCM10017583_17570 [Agromyces mediolanus]